MITKKLLSSGRMTGVRKKALMTLTGIGAAAIMFASLSMSGLAASKGTVMATAAKVRAQASTSSDSVVSLPQGTVVNIQEEVTGGDGKVWYKIVTDGGQTGYIRSDLMTKTEVEEGDTQPSDGQGQGNTLAPGVTAVNPVTAKVSGTQIRVRSNASTSGDIVTTLEQGVALTVLGTATDSTGKIWYQVNFNSDNGVVDGFVRNDFVTLEGDLTAPVDTPIVDDPPIDMPEDNVEDAPVVSQTPSTSKDYETEYKDGEWYLNIPKENAQYKISTLFEAAQKNAELYTKSKATIKTMKLVMGGLILLAAAAVIGAVMVLLRFKDLKDALEFGQTERETIEKRKSDKAQRSKELKEKGAREDSARTSQARPQGQASQSRPAQKRPATTDVSGNPVNQSRPAANVQSRPAGQAPQQKERVLHDEKIGGGEGTQAPKRPVQQGQAPQGRPQGQAPQGRPQGQAPQGRPQGQAPQARPQGQAPQGRPQGQAPQARPQGQTPQGRPQGQAPQGRPQGQAPQGRPQGQALQARPQGQAPQQTKPKNFLAEDDEFEFEFLNWDGDNK